MNGPILVFANRKAKLAARRAKLAAALTDQLQILAFVDPCAMLAVREWVQEKLVTHGYTPHDEVPR